MSETSPTNGAPLTSGVTESTQNEKQEVTEGKSRGLVTKPYQATDSEKALMQTYRQRKNKTPKIKATRNTETRAVELSLDHPDQAYGHVLLMDAFATQESDFLCELLLQLGRASSDGAQQPPNEQKLNFFAAVIKGIKPQDQIEAMIAAQMAAVHSLTMEFASKLALAGDLAWRDSAERTLNRLARTFTTQIEALKRYRTGGEQKVIVQHVSVSDGGQAIVGNVSNTGVGGKEKPESTP